MLRVGAEIGADVTAEAKAWGASGRLRESGGHEGEEKRGGQHPKHQRRRKGEVIELSPSQDGKCKFLLTRCGRGTDSKIQKNAATIVSFVAMIALKLIIWPESFLSVFGLTQPDSD